MRGMALLDRLRHQGFALVSGLGGRVGDAVRSANDALGRPLASEDELADRRAFEQGYTKESAAAAVTAAPAAPSSAAREAAPVVVYTLDDKRRGDVPRITSILDDAEVPYRLLPLDGDPAGLAAVRRDSGNKKPPLVFIAGESVGGRVELVNLGRDGIRKRVFG